MTTSRALSEKKKVHRQVATGETFSGEDNEDEEFRSKRLQGHLALGVLEHSKDVTRSECLLLGALTSHGC